MPDVHSLINGIICHRLCISRPAQIIPSIPQIAEGKMYKMPWLVVLPRVVTHAHAKRSRADAARPCGHAFDDGAQLSSSSSRRGATRA